MLSIRLLTLLLAKAKNGTRYVLNEIPGTCKSSNTPGLKQGQKRSTVEFFVSLLQGWPTTYPLQCGTATHHHDIIETLTKQQDFSISWCPRENPKGWCLPICLPKLHMPQSRTWHICYTLEELRVRHHQAIAGLSMGNHHKTHVWRTARRGWMTGKTNISNKEQVWMGWIHPSLTPTDHLFWSCTLTHQHINLYWS